MDMSTIVQALLDLTDGSGSYLPGHVINRLADDVANELERSGVIVTDVNA